MSKILIVEDSPVQALMLQHLLEQQGLKVFRACDGQSGLTMARQRMPDAILLDVNMPDMDGFEVCRRLQGDADTSHIPIIMLTAYNSPPTLRRSIFLGAIDFIPKDDFTNAVLLETLRQLHILTEQHSFPKSGEIGE
jgi:CheY-like chemotaxis protein